MKTIAEMAREAGMKDIFRDGTRWQSLDELPSVTVEELTRFAVLVREQALEEAATLVDPNNDDGIATFADGDVYRDCAEGIRALRNGLTRGG